jgi:hypothetical protein
MNSINKYVLTGALSLLAAGYGCTGEEAPVGAPVFAREHEDELIDPQAGEEDEVLLPEGAVTELPENEALTKLLGEIVASGATPALRFDMSRAGELLGVRVKVRAEQVELDAVGVESAVLDLGALTVRLGHAADAGFGRAQLVVPEKLPLARALVLKTYSRARVGGELGPVRLDMVSVFDRDDEAAGPVATLDLKDAPEVQLAGDCDALAYEQTPDVPPIAVDFPVFSGCDLTECPKAKAGWIRATHDLWRVRQMLDYIASQPEGDRAFLWDQQGADAQGEALFSWESEEVGPNTALSYYFGPYAKYRFEAIRWSYSQLWKDFFDHDLSGVEMDIECTPGGGDLCNTAAPAGHHAVKSNLKLCQKAFDSNILVFDMPRLIMHEHMHHMYVPWKDGTARLSPIQDTHTHGHGAGCGLEPVTDKGYGVPKVRHLATYENKSGNDCYHLNYTFRNNDSYAHAAVTIGTYIRLGYLEWWPLEHPPVTQPVDPQLECGQVGVVTPPPGFVDPLSKCEKIGWELSCPSVGGGPGLALLDLDLAAICPEM